jgi:hypothetical protein
VRKKEKQEFSSKADCLSKGQRNFLRVLWSQKFRHQQPMYHHSLLNAFAKLRKATFVFVIPVCLSVCPSACNNLAPTERIFKTFRIWAIFEALSTKFKFN